MAVAVFGCLLGKTTVVQIEAKKSLTPKGDVQEAKHNILPVVLDKLKQA